MPNAIDTLREAAGDVGVDYPAGGATAQALDDVEALLKAAEPVLNDCYAPGQETEEWKAVYSEHAVALAAAVRKVKEGTHEPRGLDVIEAERREEDERA